jgi:hypothetical protein
LYKSAKIKNLTIPFLVSLGGKLEREFTFMTRLEKCLLAKELGFNYNGFNGDVITPTGKILSKKTKNGYLMLTLRNKERKVFYLYAHQFAYWVIHNKIVQNIDHVDRIRTNNIGYNLRSVTTSQNAMNKSKVKGVSFCNRSKRWIANIMLNYKKIHLGAFINKDDALNCYKVNKEKYHIIN